MTNRLRTALPDPVFQGGPRRGETDPVAMRRIIAKLTELLTENERERERMQNEIEDLRERVEALENA